MVDFDKKELKYVYENVMEKIYEDRETSFEGYCRAVRRDYIGEPVYSWTEKELTIENWIRDLYCLIDEELK